MKIKAILFDMCGPLLERNPAYQPREEIETALKLSGPCRNDEEFIAGLKNDPITKNVPIEDISHGLVDRYRKIDRVWEEVLPKLKNVYKMAVINNGPYLTIAGFEEKNGFISSGIFQEFINSCKEGVAKPERRIFEIACERLGVEPEECVFIDDSEVNVEGAKSLGMAGIVYKDFDVFYKELDFLVFLDDLSK